MPGVETMYNVEEGYTGHRTRKSIGKPDSKRLDSSREKVYVKYNPTSKNLEYHLGEKYINSHFALEEKEEESEMDAIEEKKCIENMVKDEIAAKVSRAEELISPWQFIKRMYFLAYSSFYVIFKYGFVDAEIDYETGKITPLYENETD